MKGQGQILSTVCFEINERYITSIVDLEGSHIYSLCSYILIYCFRVLALEVMLKIHVFVYLFIFDVNKAPPSSSCGYTKIYK